MQTMVENPIYVRMKSAITQLAENRLSNGYLLVPLLEAPVQLEEPDPVRGWRNREAGMVSIRNSHSWFGEVSMIQHDNVPRIMIENWCTEVRPDTEATFKNQKFRVAFLKPYKTHGITSSEVALRMMRIMGLDLEANGFMLHHHYLDLGPARAPDRRITLAYINMDTNHLVYITANIIHAEWQDPNLAAFRVKGVRFKSIATTGYPEATADRLDLLLNEQLGESALRSDDAFRSKLNDLRDRGWSIHGIGDDGQHYKLVMVDPNQEEAKILFHRMKS